MTKRDRFDTLNTDKREGKTNMTYLKEEYYKVIEDERNNPFIHIDEEGNFIEPIKNPFTCEGAYELACEDVANALKADREVGYENPVYIQMLKWLDKLAYEYI